VATSTSRSWETPPAPSHRCSSEPPCFLDVVYLLEGWAASRACLPAC
jgi:hypothetical protein